MNPADEKAVLGLHLQSASLFYQTGVREDDFHDPDLRIICTAAREILLAKQLVSVASVSAKLQDQGQLEGVGGMSQIIEIVKAGREPGASRLLEQFKASSPMPQIIAILKPKADPVPEYPASNLTEGQPKDQPATKVVAHSQIELVTGPELQARVFQEPKWIVPGLLTEGSTLVVAKPKIGKTFLALQIGVSTSTGGNVLGRPHLRIDRGRVLYLGLEDGLRRLKKRLADYLGAEDFPPKMVLGATWPKMGQGGLKELQRWLEDNPDCRLVVLDTLAKLRPPRLKSADLYHYDMEVGGRLQALAAKFNIALLLVHHCNKLKADDPLDSVSGSTGLTGSADAIWILTRTRGKADAKLFATGRDFEERELALKFHGPASGWELLGDAVEVARSPERNEILDALRENGPMTVKQLSEYTGKKYDNVKGLLSKMVKGDEPIRVTEGRYELVRT